MAVPRIGAPGQGLPTFSGLAPQTTGANAGTVAGVTNCVTLPAGDVWVFPAGTYNVTPGPYTYLQFLDPVTITWKVRPSYMAGGNFTIDSDGTNWRLANTTGCAIGAVILTGGTAAILTNGIGSTQNGISFAVSSGASVWQTVVGGAIASAIATATAAGSTAGAGYTYPPTVIIDAPPAGGIQATAFCSLSGGSTVTAASITVVNQGAGYSSAPNITFVNDQRDTTGGGAFYVTTLTATGQLTALYPINHGTPLAGVPVLTASVGAASATAIMNFTVTALTTASSTAVGASIAGAFANVYSTNNLVSGTSSPILNPLHNNTGITFPRPARITALVTTGAATVTGAIIEDGGLGIQAVPTLIALVGLTSSTGYAPTFGATVGGVTDTSFIQPI